MEYHFKGTPSTGGRSSAPFIDVLDQIISAVADNARLQVCQVRPRAPPLSAHFDRWHPIRNHPHPVPEYLLVTFRVQVFTCMRSFRYLCCFKERMFPRLFRLIRLACLERTGVESSGSSFRPFPPPSPPFPPFPPLPPFPLGMPCKHTDLPRVVLSCEFCPVCLGAC